MQCILGHTPTLQFQKDVVRFQTTENRPIGMHNQSKNTIIDFIHSVKKSSIDVDLTQQYQAASPAASDRSSVAASVELTTSSLTPHQPLSKKRKICISSGNEVEEMIVKTLKGIEERREQRTMEGEEELFGRQIAATLRRFTDRQRATAKLLIQQVLTYVEFPEETSAVTQRTHFSLKL